MFGKLVLLFIAIPVLELALFIKIGGAIGLGPTLAIILLTAVLGAWLARQQGLRVLEGVRAELAAGKLPQSSLVDGLLILFAGALLLTPGFLTDTFGFLLLAPPFRAMLRPRLARALAGKVLVSGFGGAPPQSTARERRDGSDVIDIDAEIVEEKRFRR